MRVRSKFKREDTVAKPWTMVPIDSKTNACVHYYKEFFPHSELAAFLCQRVSGQHETFGSQSFAFFDCRGHIIKRSVSYENSYAWHVDMLNHAVGRIEIGPITDAPQGTSARPTEDRAMLAFDIDVEDYAEVLPCEKIPDKESGLDAVSWQHMALSATMLDLFLDLVAFRNDSNYRSLAVFSGRRGIHLWLPDYHRDWYGSLRVSSLIASLKCIACDQNAALNMVSVLRGDERGRMFLEKARCFVKSALGEESTRWSSRNGTEKLHCFRKVIESSHTGASQDVLDFVCVKMLAPRVDAQVSRQYKHILKAPFSVHPGSGAVSLPVNLHMNMLPQLENIYLDVRNVDSSLPKLQAALNVLKEFVAAATRANSESNTEDLDAS